MAFKILNGVDANSKKITNLATGTNPTDGVNLQQLEDALAVALAGIDFKNSVRVTTTAALPAVTYNNGSSGVGATLTANSNGAFPTTDGITLDEDDSILVQHQATLLQNGIYTLTTVGDGSNPFVLTRRGDADNSPEGEVTSGMFVATEEGTTYAGRGYILVTPDDPVVIGTSDIEFTPFNLVTYLGGNGINLTGTTFSIQQNGTTLTIGADHLDVALATNGGLEDSSGVKVKADVTSTGSIASVLKLGANGVGVGVDDSTIEGSAAGGNLRVKDGGITPAKASSTFKALYPVVKEFTSVGGASSENFTHNLNNDTHLWVSVKNTVSGNIEYPDVALANVNYVTVNFGADPSTNYKVTVIGADKN